MSTAVADPRAEREALLKEVKEITEAARADGRETLTPEEQQKASEKLHQAGELASRMTAALKTGEILDQLKTADELTTRLEEQKGEERVDNHGGQGGVKSPGQMFVDSAGYKSMREAYGLDRGGSIPESAQPAMVPVQLGGLKEISEGAKTIVNVGGNTTASGNAAPMVVNDQRGLVPPLFRPLTVLDLIVRGQTGSDTVEYFREIARTNSAAPVAEATATGGSSGTKPESALRFERVTAAVRTIAHWIPITRKALADVGQIRTIIDQYMLVFLDEILEDQVLNGDNTGENLDGINTVASGTEAFATDLFVTTRKSLTTIRGNLVRPTAFVLNPADVESIDLATDDVGRFYGQGPFGFGPRTLWGLPVVESPQQASGLGLVGDFRQAILYDREQASVQTGTINDQFVRNMLTILAELRAALAVQRAVAFRKIDLTA